MKNFKLKSRALFEELCDEESQLEAEMDAMAEKC